MNGRWTRIAIMAMLTAVAAVTACGSHPDRTTSITVYASSSLIKPFTAIGKEFQAANPGYSVEFVFAGSAELSAALADGADADVFASADTANMTVVANAGVVSGPPVPFAATKLVVVAPPGNPGRITSFTDLGRPGLRVAVCAADGACGSATELAEQRAGIRLPSAISETTSSGVLKDVTTGKADAGVVFVTDARASGDSVSWIPLPEGIGDVTSWISLIKDTGDDAKAADFVREVTGAGGRRILASYGFAEPVSSPVG